MAPERVTATGRSRGCRVNASDPRRGRLTAPSEADYPRNPDGLEGRLLLQGSMTPV